MKNKLIISTIIGLILASLMMYLAWQHNPQCEIHCEEIIHFSYWVGIGFSWFILGFIVTLLFTIILI
jgi:hypothetical protein